MRYQEKENALKPVVSTHFWLYQPSAQFQVGAAGAAALLGNLADTAIRRYQKRGSA
ncbi:hypothetical protein KQI82_14095 [Oscillibacter sp. MSJ-2]|uniref:Uncharacterized protein n=1 Tax=Dysosmobacter acutus TaxID=2841504 RepID=A0ABS6FDA3_9FIRM|nr:hypothetical protein [Dysosmobacter acutus]MBU5628040.1 hypothetical protein [Dysosmobacter acutus]